MDDINSRKNFQRNRTFAKYEQRRWSVLNDNHSKSELYINNIGSKATQDVSTSNMDISKNSIMEEKSEMRLKPLSMGDKNLSTSSPMLDKTSQEGCVTPKTPEPSLLGVKEKLILFEKKLKSDVWISFTAARGKGIDRGTNLRKFISKWEIGPTKPAEKSTSTFYLNSVEGREQENGAKIGRHNWNSTLCLNTYQEKSEKTVNVFENQGSSYELENKQNSAGETKTEVIGNGKTDAEVVDSSYTLDNTVELNTEVENLSTKTKSIEFLNKMYTTTEQSSQTFGNFENREEIKTREEEKQESKSEKEQLESGAEYQKEPDTAEESNDIAEKYFSNKLNDTQQIESNIEVKSMKREESVKETQTPSSPNYYGNERDFTRKLIREIDSINYLGENNIVKNKDDVLSRDFESQTQLPTILSDPIAMPLIGNNYIHPPLFEYSKSNGDVRSSTSQKFDNLSDADQYNKPLAPTTSKKEEVINQKQETETISTDIKYKSTGNQLDLNNGLENSIYGKNGGNATQKSFLFPISVPKVPEEVRNKRFLTPAFIKFMGLDDESESEEKKAIKLQTNKEPQSAEKKLDNSPKAEEAEIKEEVDLITSPVDTVSAIDTTLSKATEHQTEQTIEAVPTEIKIVKKEKTLPEQLERRKEIRRRKRPKTIASCQPSRDQMRADKENTTELEARRKDFAKYSTKYVSCQRQSSNILVFFNSKQRVSFEDQSQPYEDDGDDFQRNDFSSPIIFTNKISSRKEVPMVVSKRDSISELQTKTVTDELLPEVGKRPKRRHITRQQSRDDQSIGAKYVERKQDIDDDSSKTKFLVIIKNGTYQTMDPPADKYHSLKPEPRPIEVLPSAEFCAKGMEHIQPILEELIKTEESYVESIWKGLKNYGNVFEQRDLPRGMKGKKYVLFGNIEQIAEFHRDVFLPMLLRNRNNIKQLFDEFQRYIEEDYFYAYVLYAMNNQRSLELCNENKKFFKTMQAKCEDNLGINSFLLQPIQRVPRYSLMLKEFIKKLFDKYPLKPLIDSCCRLDRRLQILLNAINKSEVINDVDCISETHEFNIFYQGKFRDVAEFNCHDFTLKRNYRSKLFIYEKCIIYTEVKRKQLVFRGRYPREHLGMTMQNKSFTLYYDRLKQQECEFVGDPALVRQWQDLIRDIINAYAVEEKARLQELHNPEVVHRRQRRAANLSLFRDSNRFSTDSGISNT